MSKWYEDAVVRMPLRAGVNHLPPAGDLITGVVVRGLRGRVRVEVCDRPVTPWATCGPRAAETVIPLHLNLARLAFRARTLHVDGDASAATAEVHCRRVLDAGALARLHGRSAPQPANPLHWYLHAGEDAAGLGSTCA